MMRKAVSTPRRLPFAPHPMTAELVSSWLLRAAAGNGIDLEDLLSAFLFIQPDGAAELDCLDFDLPRRFRLGLASFCRVAPEAIQDLELQQQFPGVPRTFFLRYSGHLRLPGRGSAIRARYAFCVLCLREHTQKKTPAFIPARGSLATATVCHQHHSRLTSCCPVCGAEDPLSFPVLLQHSRFCCRSCGADPSTRLVPFHHVPCVVNVIQVESAYMAAVAGAAPVWSSRREMSGPALRELIESLVLLFSSRFPEHTHILARYFIDWRLFHPYFHAREVAEVKLAYFGWRWRYAVMLSVLQVLTSDPSQSPSTGNTQYGERHNSLFLQLIRLAAPTQQLEIVDAARRWPESLQLQLWAAIERAEGPLWSSSRSLRFKGSGGSPL
jgi:TniQ